MLSEHRFKTWHIFDCALTKDAIGHHYWETRSLAEELVRSGRNVRLFTHRDAPAATQFPGVEIVPAFSMYLYEGVSNDPAWSAIENFVIHNRTFQTDLARFDPSRFRDSIALFPTIGERQLLGLLRWLEAMPSELRPKSAVCLMAPQEWSGAARMYKTIWKNCPADLKREMAMFSRTIQIADMFDSKCELRSGVFPLVLPEHRREPTSSTVVPLGRTMVVSYLGGSRREKGALLIPDIVKQCAALNVHFDIQVQTGSDNRFDSRTHTALAGLSNVRIRQGTLERDEFYHAMTGSVALLPYDPHAYRWQDSSIYHESKLLNVPVLVTKGTWMAEEVSALGNGLVIEDFSAAAVVECVARAQRELPTLRNAAVRVGQEFRRTQGVAACIAKVMQAFAEPAGSPVPNPPHFMTGAKVSSHRAVSGREGSR